MLSNACKYAIRSVLYLAINAEDKKKKGVKLIAQELEVPQPFLAKLLQQLTKNGLISSSKGPKGGFFLNEDNFKITICDIIKCIDGENVFTGCFMGLKSCGDKNPCPVHFKVAAFKKTILAEFKDKSILEFVEEFKSNGRHITLKNLI